MEKRTTPSKKKSHRRSRVGQTFSTLTRFIENTCKIYIFKKVYYKNIFNDLPNDTNYIP
jgi:hypothetical protein